MGQLSQGSGPVREHGPRGLLPCLSESSFGKCLQSHGTRFLVTVDGFGFGTLTGESCLKIVHCHTDRASWDAILVTVVAFGALMWGKVCTVTQFRLGEGAGGGGGDTIGGGGGVGEPRTGIIYALLSTMVYIRASFGYSQSLI